jgi:hypothetical protein
MRMTARLLLLAVSVVGLPNIASAQSFPMIVQTSVLIANEGNARLSFQIRPENGEWKNFTLESGRNRTFDCRPCEVNAFEIAIKTGDDRSVNYILPLGGRFALRWNDRRQLWDVVRREPQ